MNNNRTNGEVLYNNEPIRSSFPERFNFFEDPGHGWLEVPHRCIDNLDLLSRISSYSYQNQGNLYLEQDQDAGIFIEAYLKLIGYPEDYKYFWSLTDMVHHEESPVRKYRHYKPLIRKKRASSKD